MSRDDGSAGLTALLEHLKGERGFDFTGYKRASLGRRITKRLDTVGCPSYERYVDYLEVHPEEFELLFNTILINVTGFFRDPEAWRLLAEQPLKALLAAKGDEEPIRVWSSACASGEETYTAAMLLVELLGEEAYLERVKIYATDVDEEALDQARAGVYEARQVEDVPEALRERCFEVTDEGHVFRKDLRRTVIFGRNDLVQDAPISRIDLLLCRNVMIYFTAETQARILRRMHFALQPAGLLFMGKSEMLTTHSSLFTPVDMKCRIFEKVPSLDGHRPTGVRAWTADGDGDRDGASGNGLPALQEMIVEAAPLAQLVVDQHGVLRTANAEARTLLRLAPEDVGRSFSDLEVSYRPLELRSHIDKAMASGLHTTLEPAELDGQGPDRTVEVQLAPLMSNGDALGISITFADVTRRTRLQAELEQSKRELEASYEELQSTVEELETINEELQSTNEELETTNEELQSTNEELETMNEELQSTNEELETTNEELHVRTVELNEVNGFLEGILTSLGRSVIVLDRSLRVRVWNDESFELWGLRPEETHGEHLLGLDFGLPVAELKAALRACVDGETQRADLVVDATNRRGRAFRSAVSIVALRTAEGEVTGAIVLMGELPAD